MIMEILYQDDAILVVNKPAGLSTLPDGYDPSLPNIRSVLEQQVGPLWVVHRLDKDTSGVLLLARSPSAHRSLNSQFEQRLVSKVYHALIFGNPDWQVKTVSLSLRSNGDRLHRTVVDQVRGKPAVTHFKVLERFSHSSLVEAVPETGRTHQIRAHLYSLGLFILGDKLYRRRADLQDYENAPQFDARVDSSILMGLHSRSLEITHPSSGQRMKFKAAYPSEFSAVVEQLRSLPYIV
jgi:tRNA pseudouridine32 synthase/23S rRNA pseudouridine746 synthase